MAKLLEEAEQRGSGMTAEETAELTKVRRGCDADALRKASVSSLQSSVSSPLRLERPQPHYAVPLAVLQLEMSLSTADFPQHHPGMVAFVLDSTVDWSQWRLRYEGPWE